MKIINQTPSYIEPWWQDNLTKNLDADSIKNAVKHIFRTLYTPLIQTTPVQILDDNNTAITDEDVAEAFLRCTGELLDVGAENFMREFFSQTMSDYDKRLAADRIFVAQANVTASCPPPSANVYYIPADLRDACRKYMADRNRNLPFLQCTESFVMPEPHIAVHFLSKPVFDDYKAYVKNFVQTFLPNMLPDDAKKCSDFDHVQLDTMEGLILRAADGDACHAYSFERVLVMATLAFLQDPRGKDAGLIVPYLSELICPRSILFLDVEQFARAPKNKLDKLVKEYQDVMKQKVHPIQLKNIAKMSQTISNAKRIQGQVKNYGGGGSGTKRAKFIFSKKSLPQKDLCRMIRKIIEREYNVSMSENCQKNVVSSYHRPNRRHPENFALKGRSRKTIYKPDLHIYLDTSGSISEDNYKSGIMLCIQMCMKLGINMYFNSFASDISQCAKLNTKGKNVMQAYEQFRHIPKVGGGTSFHKVWAYIMESPKRRKEISFMITDFGYYPPSKCPEYPSKLWYIPITTDPSDWDDIRRMAKDFCEGMFHIDNGIRKKIIM